MYFSLIRPSDGQERDAAHQRLEGPYADHQWLWKWFPAEPGSARDFLYRQYESEGGVRFYVVSKRPPVPALGAWQAFTRDYFPEVVIGDRFQFELRANPTVRHGRDGKSKRHDVVMEAKQKLLLVKGLKKWSDWQDESKPDMVEIVQSACGNWLQRRGLSLGFEVDLGVLTVNGYDQHREKEGKSLRFSTADFSGMLTVVDPNLFIRALSDGIGSAKAFGCGLLLVRRLGD